MQVESIKPTQIIQFTTYSLGWDKNSAIPPDEYVRRQLIKEANELGLKGLSILKLLVKDDLCGHVYEFHCIEEDRLKPRKLKLKQFIVDLICLAGLAFLYYWSFFK